MSPKVRFQMFLEPEQLEALQDIQEDTGVAVAEQIRRAIDAYLEQQDRKRRAARKR